MWNILLMAAGFVLLVQGAKWLVDGASALAKRLRVSDLMVGLTVVAFGTSMPELTVNVISAVEGNPAIAIGNVLGSNIANILLILGISAMIFPLEVQKGTVWKEIPFSLLAALVLGVAANDIFLSGGEKNILSAGDGLIFLFFFLIFMVYIFETAKSQRSVSPRTDEAKIKILTPGKSALYIFLGLVGLFFGGEWTVKGAVYLASLFRVSQSLVGLTIVAVGTSLPELVTSVVAALKKNPEIAVGNVVGSNIFNIFLILGITPLVKPLEFSPASNMDIGMTVLASALLFLWAFTGKKRKIDRWEGGIFTALYAAYMAVLILRG
jgi:cation:H+ antiporter